jgi:hypothetical protein
MDLQLFAQILIEQTRTHLTSAGSAAGNALKEQVSLALKVEEYRNLLGNNTAHLSAVLVQLLTLGKVRLDFREYNDRLNLVDKADIMTRTEAVFAVESYLASLRTGETVVPEVDYTQKIIIQAPKRTVM